MISKVIAFSLKNRWLPIVGILAVIVGGIYVYTILRIEAYPDISDTNVVIITQYQGRAAEEVEQQVTMPIERSLNSVPGVIFRRSRTIFGLSVVQLTFEDNVEDFFARQYVSEKLKNAQLPPGVTPELGPLSSPTGEILRYVVRGNENYTPMDLKTLNDWVIIPKLLQTIGIADISSFGGPVKQYQVLTSPERLKKYNLTLKDLISSVEDNNLNTGGNIIERGEQGFAVRGIGAVTNVHDLRKIVISSSGGVPIFLEDVASIEIGPPYPSGILGYSIPAEGIFENSGTEGIVLLKRGEDTKETLKRLKEKLNEVISNDLPEGVEIHVIYDRSNLIDFTLKTVSRTLIEGITIVVIVLVVFLGSFSSALVVAITIPVALLFSFIMMKITGIPANLLSLGAIDFGIIVDGACIMVEHLVRSIKSAPVGDRKSGIYNFTTHSAQEIGKELFFSVVIIIIAYTPLFAMQRIEGKLFSPMAFTISFAILGSFICSITVVPVFISFIYKKKFEAVGEEFYNTRNNMLSSLADIGRKVIAPLKKIKPYELVLIRTMQIPNFGFFLIFLIITGIVFLAVRTGTEFLPPLDEGSIFFRCNLPSGISIHKSAKLAPEIRKIISKHRQVKSILTQTGRNDEGTDPFGANRTEILINLNPYNEWVNDTSKAELVLKLKSELKAAFPGAYFAFGQPIIDQVTEVVNGSAADLAVTISGENLTEIRSVGDRLKGIIEKIPGASDVGIEQEGPQGQIVVNINRENAARYGINVSDIQLMIEAAIGGKTISTVYEGTKRFDLVIRFLPESRSSIEAIKKMLVPSITGSQIPMSELADIRMVDGQTNIYRAEGKRIITVRANIRGRDQGSFAKEVAKKIKSMKLSRKFKTTLGGQFENLDRVTNQLSYTIPFTLLLIGLLLFILYKDAVSMLITILCLPIGILGGLTALWVRGYYFNVSAGVGFVSLFGVAIMAGVLLVSSYNRELRGLSLAFTDLKELRIRIISISLIQIKPIVMMITVALIGLLPAASSHGIGSDIQRPLATVIIGGLLTCLLLIPIVLPSIYFSFFKWRLKKLSNTRKNSERD
jgi:cobalt-zinc-cadmium resistance protein CzcA